MLNSCSGNTIAEPMTVWEADGRGYHGYDQGGEQPSVMTTVTVKIINNATAYSLPNDAVSIFCYEFNFLKVRLIP